MVSKVEALDVFVLEGEEESPAAASSARFLACSWSMLTAPVKRREGIEEVELIDLFVSFSVAVVAKTFVEILECCLNKPAAAPADQHCIDYSSQVKPSQCRCCICQLHMACQVMWHHVITHVAGKWAFTFARSRSLV